MSRNLHEVAKIMGVDEETVQILPKIRYDDNLMNPWGKELFDTLGTLNLTPAKTVLDLPCGQGGVSVYLAKQYGVTVDGYDLLLGFIDNANAYAVECGVQDLCHFIADDIRTAIETGKQYDVLIWSAPPHLWENYAKTILNLRKCVKTGGYIVIADAYLYSDELQERQPDYETLEKTMDAVAACGDTVVSCMDYKGTLWEDNYQADREAVKRAIQHAANPAEREILKKYLEGINESEQSDKECFGLYILVLQIAKSHPAS